MPQVLRVLAYPDPLLRKLADPIETTASGWVRDITPFLKELIAACYLYDGVAIAAPQVGAAVRVIVVDLRPAEMQGKGVPVPLVMINPQIVRTGNDAGDRMVTELEGCLSFPGVRVPVARHRMVSAKFFAKDGEEIITEFRDLQARAVQHEIEHLDGVLLIDHITSRLRRDMIERKMRLVAKRGGLRPPRRRTP